MCTVTHPPLVPGCYTSLELKELGIPWLLNPEFGVSHRPRRSLAPGFRIFPRLLGTSRGFPEESKNLSDATHSKESLATCTNTIIAILHQYTSIYTNTTNQIVVEHCRRQVRRYMKMLVSPSPHFQTIKRVCARAFPFFGWPLAM